MNDNDFMRYSRQLLLEDIAIEGQQKLLASRVLIVGLGGLGSPAALYLAGAGFTFTPASSALDHPTSRPGWLRARIVDPEIVRRCHLAQPQHRSPTPAAEAVEQLLVQQVAELIDSGAWEARRA